MQNKFSKKLKTRDCASMGVNVYIYAKSWKKVTLLRIVVKLNFVKQMKSQKLFHYFQKKSEVIFTTLNSLQKDNDITKIVVLIQYWKSYPQKLKRKISSFTSFCFDWGYYNGHCKVQKVRSTSHTRFPSFGTHKNRARPSCRMVKKHISQWHSISRKPISLWGWKILIMRILRISWLSMRGMMIFLVSFQIFFYVKTGRRKKGRDGTKRFRKPCH